MEDVLHILQKITGINQYSKYSKIFPSEAEVKSEITRIWKNIVLDITPEHQIIDIHPCGGTYLIELYDKLFHWDKLSHMEPETRSNHIINNMIFAVTESDLDATIIRKSLYGDATEVGNVVVGKNLTDSELVDKFQGRLKQFIKINDSKKGKSYKGIYGSGNFFFIRVSDSYSRNGETYSPDETVNLFRKCLENNDYTWYSMFRIPFKLNQNRLDEYHRRIDNGDEVRLLLIIAGEIKYSAKILRMYSFSEPKGCNEYDKYPAAYHGEMSKLWLKISDIRLENSIKLSDLQVTSTGSNLDYVIKNSQCFFGNASYIE